MTLYATRLEHGAGVAREVAGNVSSKIFKILPDMRDFCNSLEMDEFTLSGKRKQSLIQLQDTDKRILWSDVVSAKEINEVNSGP